METQGGQDQKIKIREEIGASVKKFMKEKIGRKAVVRTLKELKTAMPEGKITSKTKRAKKRKRKPVKRSKPLTKTNKQARRIRKTTTITSRKKRSNFRKFKISRKRKTRK